MLTESRKEFNEVLDTYEVPLAQFKADEWKRAVVSHAHGKEAFLSFVLFDFAITSFDICHLWSSIFLKLRIYTC